MPNIYVESKTPRGPQFKESLLPSSATGFSRGLAVTYGADSSHIALIAVAATAAVGILEEDVSGTSQSASVIEFGQAVAQIGASVQALQPLTTNANGQLVPATGSQPVLAVALEAQTYVAPGSYATVFVLGFLAIALAA